MSYPNSLGTSINSITNINYQSFKINPKETSISSSMFTHKQES